MLRCGTCGEPQQGTRFCGRCGALAGAGPRAGRARAAPRPAGVDAVAARRRLVGSLALAVVAALIGAAVWSAGPEGESIPDLPSSSPLGGGTELADEEVDLPDDTDDLGTGAAGEGADDRDGGSGRAPDAGGQADPSFECLVDGGCGWEVELDGIGTLHPWNVQVTDHDTLVVTGEQGLAVVGTDGQLRWSHRLGLDTQAAVAGDLILAAGGDQLGAFDGRIGSLRWLLDRSEPGQLHARAHTTSDRSTVLLVQTGSDADADAAASPQDEPLPAIVQARDATDGTLRWEREAAHVELVGDVVVLADNGLEALDATTGERRWTSDIEPRLPGHGVVDVPGAGFTAAGDEVLVVPERSPDDPTVLLDAATGAQVPGPDGAVVWVSQERGPVTGPVVVIDDLAGGVLAAVDAAGEVVWERTYDLEQHGGIALGGSNETLLLDGGPDGEWVTIDVADGAESYRTPGSDGRTPTRIPFAEDVFAMPDGTDGSVTVVGVDDTPLWRVVDVVPHQVAPELFVLVVGDTLVGLAPDPRHPPSGS